MYIYVYIYIYINPWSALKSTYVTCTLRFAPPLYLAGADAADVSAGAVAWTSSGRGEDWKTSARRAAPLLAKMKQLHDVCR